ncbi:type VII secretion integral membrane protein EccD [Catellatospora sp. NPDC049133]|uniref:type VII secretion integral membrane protein EccD n=1 Tax=Catellatospora sp. NPDC049133 TaxID=3155499 RepID=UPI003401725F
MNVSTSAERCRLTIIGPHGSIDLAVPAMLTLADVTPAIVDLLGEETAREVAGRGAVLQKLGGRPLDEEQTAAALGLRDGDVVYLNVRDNPMPTFAHDDLIEGVAAGVRQRPGRWNPARARHTLRAAAGVALAAGLAAPLSPQAGPAHALTAAGMSAVLLLAATLAARALADRIAGLVLGGGAVLYAAAAGQLTPVLMSGATAGQAPPDLAARLAAAVAMAAAVSVAVAVAVGDLRPMAFVVVATSAAVTAGALLAASGLLTPLAAAAVITVFALLISPQLPSLAFRLGGLRLPDLPTTPEDITRDVEPVPDAALQERTIVVDRYLTAGHLAIALVAAGGLWLLADRAGWAPPTLAAAVCVLLLLRTRLLTGAWARWALTAAAGWGLLLLALRLTGPAFQLIGLPAAALVTGLGLLAVVRTPDSRRPRPYWGRAAELFETTLAVALIPLLLAVLGVYGYVRGLAG